MLATHEVPLRAVMNYSLPTDQIVDRLGGRRTCEKCKAVYHINDRPPKIEDRCDQCDSKLFQREDDRPEAIKVRLEAYTQSTAPLIEYYRKLDLLVQVDGSGSAEDIFARTFLNLGSVRKVEFAREIWVYGQEYRRSLPRLHPSLLILAFLWLTLTIPVLFGSLLISPQWGSCTLKARICGRSASKCEKADSPFGRNNRVNGRSGRAWH